MKWPDPINMMEENERALLLPGETPLAFEIAMQMPGYDAIGRDERARANVTLERPDLTDLIFPTAYGGLDVNNDWIDQRLGGTTAAGGLNSIAAGFQHAITDVGTKKLLVSTSRLALIGDEGRIFGSSPTTIKWELDRRAVHAEHARRFTQMGRVRLRFADGSWAMLMLGIFLTRAAKRVIRAVNAPHQPQANQPRAHQSQPNQSQPNQPQPNQPDANQPPSNWQQQQAPSQPHGTPSQPSSYGTPPPGQYGAARPPVGPPQPPQYGAGQPQHGAAPPRPPQPGTPPQQHGAPPQAPPYGAPHPGPQQPPQFGTPPPHHQPPR